MRGLRNLRHWLVLEIHFDHGHGSGVLFFLGGDDAGHGLLDGLRRVECWGESAGHVRVIVVPRAHGYGRGGCGRRRGCRGVCRRTASWSIVVTGIACRCLTLLCSGVLHLLIILSPWNTCLDFFDSHPLASVRQGWHSNGQVSLPESLDDLVSLACLLDLLRSSIK